MNEYLRAADSQFMGQVGLVSKKSIKDLAVTLDVRQLLCNASAELSVLQMGQFLLGLCKSGQGV